MMDPEQLVIGLVSAGGTFYFINFMVPNFIAQLNRFVQTDIRQFVSQRVNSPERLSLPPCSPRNRWPTR